jgi:hypothetical protein
MRGKATPAGKRGIAASPPLGNDYFHLDTLVPNNLLADFTPRG